MRIPELIRRKRDGESLGEREIEELITAYVRGEVPDYQMAAFLMAVYFRGMTEEETAALTRAMVRSGEQADLRTVGGVTVDKHSTGGVGDTTTLVLLPLAASAGVRVAKMSGRGLGFTGGTLDKLAAIPGFRTELSVAEFTAQIRRIGLAVTGQSPALVPADGRLYALRDVTATVESIPLIASSVMSKKIAAGADKIVLDVKVGRGALIRDRDRAEELGRLMVQIARRAGREATVFLTDMDQPLGLAVGNALEVAEAIRTLQGRGHPALVELCLELGAEMMRLAGVEADPDRAKEILLKKLESGEALEKFREWVRAQGGDERIVDDPSRLPAAPFVQAIQSDVDVYIRDVDALRLGRCAAKLGAGRQRKGDAVDPSVGIVMGGRVGDRIERGRPVAVVHAASREDLSAAVEEVRQAVSLSREKVPGRPAVIARIAGVDTFGR
ncbi:MAG: thymidine phosphorylase [Alicyclobacillaceae bacterium]|nr:thymidine phosphorylase [Alicyclobacillaceae bacterium]